MKFTITNTAIQETVLKMGRLLNAKTTLPILNGVLVEAQQDCILFSASDGSESIIHRVLLVEEDGESVVETGRCVFPRELFDSAKKMKGAITIEASDTAVTVKQAKTKLHFSVMNADEYPKIDTDSRTTQIVLSGKEFSDIVAHTTFAASKSDVRPILSAVNMLFTQEESIFIATDSHRLSAFHSKGVPTLEETISMAVPATALDKAMKSFELSKDVILLPSSNSIALANGNTILFSVLLDGNYPETKRLIPSDFESELVVNRTELIDGLELLAAVTTNNVIAFNIGQLFVELSASGTDKKGTQELAFELYEGVEDFSISFSTPYVLDVLKRLDTKSVRFQFSGSMKPFLIVGEDSSYKNTQLVLPVRQY